MRFETLAVHAGEAADPVSGALAPSIHVSTTFERAADGTLRGPYIYGRTDNPTRHALEDALAALEGGAACAAFASGSAATMSILQALRPGDHVIAPQDAYYGTGEQLRSIFAPWGLETSFIDMTDAANVRAAVRPATRLIWVETPSNPLVMVADIEAIAEIGWEVGATIVVDNTWATPALQRPLELGAHLVMHSTTKYLSGHHDVLGGAVVARTGDDEMWPRIRSIQQTGGAVPSPFESWLVLRGIRTLPWRMRAHCDNAMRVACFLADHARVEVVHYPGLASHPGHAVACRQMPGFGGMLSVQIRGGRDEALGVKSRVRLFKRATSLGGPESLIEHRATAEGPASRAPANLLRLSIGLEHADDLVADLAEALE